MSRALRGDFERLRGRGVSTTLAQRDEQQPEAMDTVTDPVESRPDDDEDEIETRLARAPPRPVGASRAGRRAVRFSAPMRVRDGASLRRCAPSVVLIHLVWGDDLDDALRPVLGVTLVGSAAGSATWSFMAIWAIEELDAKAELPFALLVGAVFAALSGFLGGYLSDRIGRRRVILFGQARDGRVSAPPARAVRHEVGGTRGAVARNARPESSGASPHENLRLARSPRSLGGTWPPPRSRVVGPYLANGYGSLVGLAAARSYSAPLGSLDRLGQPAHARQRRGSPLYG